MKKSAWLVLLILFLGTALRLYQFGSHPPALTWDEAALGYVGQMVVRTGFDEYGQWLPRIFTSFGDFKAPLAFYLIGASTSILGLSTWAVRLPMLILGLLTLLVSYWVTRRATNNHSVALMTMLLLAVSPWHIHFSRIAFESGAALFFFLIGLGSWLEIRQELLANKPLPKKLFFFDMLWTISWILALASYHASRVVIPIVFILIVILELPRAKKWLKKWPVWIVPILTMAFGLWGLRSLLFASAGWQRAIQTTSVESGLFSLLWSTVQGFSAHGSLSFLLQGATSTARHGFPGIGVLTVSQAALVFLGISVIIWELYSKNKTNVKSVLPSWFWIALLITGILPAALGQELPHPNRALLAVYPFMLIAAFGWNYLIKKVGKEWPPSVVGYGVLLLLLESILLINSWQKPPTVSWQHEWLAATPQVMQLAHKMAAQNKSVLVTNKMGEPGILYAFYNNIPYDHYRSRYFGNISFGTNSNFDPDRYDVVILRADETFIRKPTYTIDDSEKKPLYSVYEMAQ